MHGPMKPGLRIVLYAEDIEDAPWDCFWLIHTAARRHGVHSSQLRLRDATQYLQSDRWLLDFKIKEA